MAPTRFLVRNRAPGDQDGRLPLMILGGFLGAGKTTWLRHHLYHGMAAHVLVNEASGLSVDDALLTQAKGLTLLAGGCACCDGRAALIHALRDLADRRSRGEALADLILETSGLADPAAIMQAVLADPVLVHHIRPTGTTVLVDAQNGFAVPIPALALSQMRAAQSLILTKVEGLRPARLAELAETLRAMNPLADVSAASHGVATDLPDLTARPLTLTAETHPMRTCTLILPDNADWPALSLWLSGILHRHGDHILRVKGVVRSPAGRLLIQSVRRTVQPPEMLPEGLGADNQLAVIGQGFDPDALSRSLARFLGP